MMSRTVPCPNSVPSHDEHDENSPEYRACRESERRRILDLQRIATERSLGGTLAEDPSAPGYALTVAQKLAALANQTRPQGKSDGPSFGG